MSKYVLYSDRSGIFGKWFLGSFGEWTFKRETKCDFTEEDMKYALEELEKIKNEN